jgi:hypothetical protein
VYNNDSIEKCIKTALERTRWLTKKWNCSTST